MAPVVLFCPHPVLGTKTFSAECRRKNCRPLLWVITGNSHKDCGRASHRKSKALETTRAGLQLCGLEELLNVSELQRAEHRGRNSPVQGRAQAVLPPAVLGDPDRGSLAAVESLQMRSCMCLPLPPWGPKPHRGPCHFV